MITEEEIKITMEKYGTDLKRNQKLLIVSNIFYRTALIGFMITLFIGVMGNSGQNGNGFFLWISGILFRAVIISPFVFLIINEIMSRRLYSNRVYLMIKGTHAVKTMNTCPYSLKAAEELGKALASEKLPQNSAYYRNLMFECLYANGEFSQAHDILYEDRKYFDKNPAAELQYLNSLIKYHTAVNEPSQAEEAYRRFEAVRGNIPEKKKRSSDIILTVNAAINILYCRRDYEKCDRYIGLLRQYDPDKENRAAVRSAESAMKTLMQAECRYNTGNYESALKLCEGAAPFLRSIPFQMQRINMITQNIRRE